MGVIMTDMYRERPSRVPGAVVWTAASGPGEKRVLPDGCMDLIWNGRDVLIAGPDTHAQVFAGDDPTTFTGLRFAPGFGPRVIRIPAHALTDLRMPLAAAWPASAVRRLVDDLASSAAPGRVLEDAALEIAGPEDREWLLIETLAARARRGESVAAIATAVGWSTRHLQRRCRDAFGYGAKTLERILRMTRAVELAYEGTAFAATAARSGYADQAHLAREMKALAGVPLGQLVALAGSDANRSTELPSGSWSTA
jgi:AraC-like DNA-binding protein